MALGSRLKYIREAKGYSQQYVADRIIPIGDEPQPKQGTIQKIESRDNRSSKYEDQIAEILQVPLAWLKHGNGDDPLHSNATINVANNEQTTFESDTLNRDTLLKVTGKMLMEENSFLVKIDSVEPTHGVSVHSNSNKFSAIQIVGGNLPMPFRDGWCIVISVNGELKEGEPVVLKMKDESYMMGEYLFSKDESLDLIHLGNATRITILKENIAAYFPVKSLIAPSERKLL